MNGLLPGMLGNIQGMQQIKQQNIEQANQQQAQQLVPLALGGDQQALQQLYSVNPQMAGQIEQRLQGQMQNQQQQQQQAQVQQLRAAALSGNQGQMQQLIAIAPEEAELVFGFIDRMDDQSKMQKLQNATALKIALDKSPEQAKQFFEAELANDPVFAGLADNFANEDYEGALSELAMGIGRIDLDAYENLFSPEKGASIGTYNPRDYTVESFSNFVRSNDPSQLERYTEKTIDVGGVPHRLNAQTGSYEPLSTATSIAESEAEIAGAKTGAQETARQDVQAESPEAVEQRRLKEQERDRALGLVNNLLGSERLGQISGAETGAPVLGRAQAMFAKDELNDLRSLMNLMTMGNLGRMSGVLSESDIRLIAQAASGLEVGESGTPVSEQRLREILTDIKGRLGGQQTAQQQEPAQAYSEGTVIRNPSTGETMIMRNGNWVAQ